MIRPILFVCFGGCLVLGILLIFVGVGVIVFTQVNTFAVSLLIAGLVFLGLAGLFFILMIQEEKRQNRKGKTCYLFSVFSFLFSLMTGVL